MGSEPGTNVHACVRARLIVGAPAEASVQKHTKYFFLPLLYDRTEGTTQHYRPREPQPPVLCYRCAYAVLVHTNTYRNTEARVTRAKEKNTHPAAEIMACTL